MLFIFMVARSGPMSAAQRAFWKLRLSLSGSSLDKLEYLKQAQGLDGQAAKELQKQRLEKLVLHAFEHVPFYQQLFTTHRLLDDRGRVCFENFFNLPLLDKQTIRENWQNLKSDDLDQRTWWENTSGGSTGEPVRFIQDSTYHEWATAEKMLFDEWTGYELGDKKLTLWGSERDLLVGRESFKTYLGRWLRNEIMLNSFKMSPETMREYVDTINTFKPKQILAYVESIYELARFIEREKLQVYSPDAIMTSAGTLHGHMREKIETIFKAPIFNRYGSREVGDIACEDVSHSGLVVSAPTHYVELLNQEGLPTKPGEVGEVVVTLLTNFAMPLIRYRIGDMGVWAADTVAHSRSWAVLSEVTGRVTDSFLTQDGTQVYGEYFTHLFYFQNWVEKFQVVQESLAHVVVNIVPVQKDGFDPSSVQKELDDIRHKIEVVMGECQLDFAFVDNIAPTASGKYRYTISKVTENNPAVKVSGF